MEWFSISKNDCKHCSKVTEPRLRWSVFWNIIFLEPKVPLREEKPNDSRNCLGREFVGSNAAGQDLEHPKTNGSEIRRQALTVFRRKKVRNWWNLKWQLHCTSSTGDSSAKNSVSLTAYARVCCPAIQLLAPHDFPQWWAMMPLKAGKHQFCKLKLDFAIDNSYAPQLQGGSSLSSPEGDRDDDGLSEFDGFEERAIFKSLQWLRAKSPRRTLRLEINEFWERVRHLQDLYCMIVRM